MAEKDTTTVALATLGLPVAVPRPPELATSRPLQLATPTRIRASDSSRQGRRDCQQDFNVPNDKLKNSTLTHKN